MQIINRVMLQAKAHHE
jgi:hypothetical protein